MSDTPVVNGKTLSCVLADDKAYVGKEVKLEIAVTSCVNYRDYYLTVNLTVTDCNHPSSELRNVLKATCTDHGYSGDLCCTKCNAVVKAGEETPIDPDAHDFDYSDKSDVSKAPTYLSCGEHTYHCKRNHNHTIVVADIPKLSYVDAPENKTEISNKKKDVLVDLLNSKGSGTVSGIYQSPEDTISSNYTVTNGKITDVSFDTSQLKEGVNRLTMNTGTRIALPGMFTVSDNFATKKEFKKAKKFVSHKKSGYYLDIKKLGKKKTYELILVSEDGKKILDIDVVDISLSKKIKKIALTTTVSADLIAAKAVSENLIDEIGYAEKEGVVTIATSPVLKSGIPGMEKQSARFISGIWMVGNAVISRGQTVTVKKRKAIVNAKVNDDGTLSIAKAEGSGKGSIPIKYVLNGKVTLKGDKSKMSYKTYKTTIKVK